MTGTFYSVDGSRMRYDSSGQTTGTLYFPDGSRYTLSTSAVQYIDRNGNILNYNVANRQWTDTLGRVIGMPWPVNPGPGDYSYSLPAFNNTTVAYTLKFRSLSSALTPDAQGQTPALKLLADYYLPDPNSPPSGQSGSNFPQPNAGSSLFFSGYTDPDESVNSYVYMIGRGQSGGSLFNPTVLTEIVFPNGQSYKFSYDIYGELDKVIYPTGGYQRYTYSTVSPPSNLQPPYGQGSRGMTSRIVSASGTGTDEVQWLYSGSNWPMTVTAPDGGRTETYLFLPNGSPSNNFGYKEAREGMVVEERVYAPASQGGAMLRRTLHDYAQTSATFNKPVPPNTFNTGTYTAYRNARRIRTVHMILDTGTDALAKNMTFEYPPNGFEFSTGLDRTATNEYHFATVNPTTAQSGTIAEIPSGPLASRAETTYLNNSAYQNRNILALSTSVLLKDASLQIVTRTDTFYDEAAYPLLTYGDLGSPDYSDPGTTARGNITTTRRYVDTAANLYLDTHSQVDQCGNARVAWNVRGNPSQTDFSSTYKHAYPTQAKTPIPDPLGTHGLNVELVTSNTYDYTTGVPLTATDANGQVTSMSYQDDGGVNDPLTRLRKVTRPDGSWTKYSFGESIGNVYTLTETKQDATRTTKTYQYVDPLGRPSRSFASETATNYIATDTIYDQMGRPWKISNPYRTATLDGVANLSHSSDWTVTQYDSLNRVVLVTLPDASTAQTSYQGVYTTLIDQAGRQRRQKTDALGRIVRVDEPDATGNLGAVDTPTQASSYDYNVQGNLLHIAQGSSPIQHRYFKYDALGRLLYERQVEQAGTFTVSDSLTGNSSWSRKLVYDETIGGVPYQGLLTSAYDARNVQSQFRYDNLDRVYQVTYSDTTPAITKNYDQARTGFFNKGELTEATTAAVGSVPATTHLYDYDLMGRIAKQQQIIAGQTYTLGYGYTLGGVLASETYPSGRVVNYGYDDGARLLTVSSGATTYAGQFDYTSSSGLLKSVVLGNGALESYAYNSRLQLQSVDLTRSGSQIEHYDYKYGVYNPVANTIDESKNNGQIAQIEGFIGAQKQWQQRFAYDTLGRLASAREFRGDNSQQSYLVNYEYDVFGNRYQKQAQNAGNPFTQKWVETADVTQATNRFSSGVTYDSAGNITVDSKFRNLQFQYDANNRQKQSANLDGTGAVVSVYDANGQRVGTQIGGSLTSVLIYDVTAKLVAEYNSTTANGGTQYVFSDHQSAPRTITNTSGTVVSRHDYLPYGEELSTIGMRTSGQGYGGLDASRRKYAGMENDDATGLGHTLWRQYDSYSARWTAPDPYGGSIQIADPQSFNRYTYVNGDPMNHVDPLGLMLSDIGVYQTEDPEQARIMEHQSLRDLQKSVNDDYTKRHQAPSHINALHEAGHMIGDQTKTPATTTQRLVVDEDPSVNLETPQLIEPAGDVIVNVTGWYPHQPDSTIADCRIRAMLDTIAFSEGADYGTVVRGTVIRSPAHPELVGRRNVTVTDFSDHPNALVRVGPNLTSTAAGRYQFLHRTWTSLGLPDFTPRSQDQGAITLMRRRGMIGPLMAGDVQTAITNGNREWASLPGSPYGQGTRPMNRLVNVYNNALQRCTQ